MNQPLHPQNELTKNQSLVMGALKNADGPLSAYTILDRLRDDGFRAPLQVYRALEKLIDLGMVHKLESLNSFVACSHSDCSSHAVVVFGICENCETVSEFDQNELVTELHAMAKTQAFIMKRSVVEMRGLCRNCSSARAN